MEQLTQGFDTAEWVLSRLESESLSETLTQVKSDHGKYIISFSASNQIVDSKELDYLLRWKGAIEAVGSRADR
jgi:hypothetical protein